MSFKVKVGVSDYFRDRTGYRSGSFAQKRDGSAVAIEDLEGFEVPGEDDASDLRLDLSRIIDRQKSKRNRTILRMLIFYGKTQSEVARTFGVSQARIHQIFEPVRKTVAEHY